MEKLKVLNIESLNRESSLQEISTALDKIPGNELQHAPWLAYPYKPYVSFAIAHHNDCIFLKYFVREKAIRATCNQPNEPVYKDSCTEFFIAFGDENDYYNFEFNCVGICLLGYGPGKEERMPIATDVIRKIRYQSILKSSDAEETSWELTLMIPVDVFIHHKLNSLKDRRGKANFYKCGDELPEPHFLAWRNIKTASPDFHLPEFFGTIEFM